MTYRGFHYRITMPLLAACYGAWILQGSRADVGLPILFLCLIVVVFTFPWDNWAVRRLLWEFPDERLLFRIDRLPIEEIAFFVLQTLQVSFLTLAFCAMEPISNPREIVFTPDVMLRLAVLFSAWGIIGAGSIKWRESHVNMSYAWHLFYWFLPVVIAQWLFAAEILMPRIDVIVLSTIFIGGVLSIADVWAVQRGIWFFDSRQITGIYIARVLPWEEVAFFFVTSLLVAQSILLFVPAELR